METSLTCTLEPRGACVYATISGAFTLKSAQSLTEPMLAACAEHGLTKLFIDCRNVSGRPYTMDRYHYALAVAAAHDEHQARGHLPVQFCLLGHEPVIDPDRFGEKIATIRGVNVKATTDPDEAATWLGIPRNVVK